MPRPTTLFRYESYDEYATTLCGVKDNIFTSGESHISGANPPSPKRHDPEYILQLLNEMEQDVADACVKVIIWLGERPKGTPVLSRVELEKLREETRLEIIRKRLGEVVERILPFVRSTVC